MKKNFRTWYRSRMKNGIVTKSIFIKKLVPLCKCNRTASVFNLNCKESCQLIEDVQSLKTVRHKFYIKNKTYVNFSKFYHK